MGEASRKARERRAAREAEAKKMWKLDITDYEVEVEEIDERTGRIIMENGRPKKVKDVFDMRGSLENILFNPALQLSPQEAFDARDLSDKIKDCTKTHVLLTAGEMGRLRRAYDEVRGPSPNSLECLRRIRDAEEVEPKEVIK